MNSNSRKKILVANRGEIARRVIQAIQESGNIAVAIYADPDRLAWHVQEADEAYRLPGEELATTYLDVARIVGIAKDCGADAIHPGYGFLSENAGFAEACAAAEIVFIGPKPETIRLLGDKVTSKSLAQRAEVPVIPGYEGELPSGEALFELADGIGYPLLIKASAGGGGKGMRVVHEPGSLLDAIQTAQREALAYFKNDRVFLEKYLLHPRHVEVQIFGDDHGNLVHLGERECSMQRRHQKMIEESPSPSIPPQVREDLCQAALRIAREVGYRSAGTVEFIVDQENRFYFLEVNTRLQVEHPVTEEVFGVDLVQAQIVVAAGKPLPWRQEDLKTRGHAIECRLYAEDPENQFLPSQGSASVLREPQGVGYRVDSALQEGQEIASIYDPMLAKLIVRGEDRVAALRKMDRLLQDYVLLGIRHNLDFLRHLVGSKEFRGGHYSTSSAVALLEGFLGSRSELAEPLWMLAGLAGKMVSAAEQGVEEGAPSGFDLKNFRNV